MLLASIFLALAAIVATPETESPQFVMDAITSCVPVQTDTFVGCDLPAAYGPKETGFAGFMWDKGEPLQAITGP